MDKVYFIYINSNLRLIVHRMLSAEPENISEPETADGGGRQVRGADVPSGCTRPSAGHAAAMEGS